MDRIKALAACGVGMSISQMSQKVKAAATARNIQIDIRTLSIDQMRLADYAGYDVIILGPHVKYQMPKIREAASAHGVQVIVLEPSEYAMFDGDKVLDKILAVLGKERDRSDE